MVRKEEKSLSIWNCIIKHIKKMFSKGQPVSILYHSGPAHCACDQSTTVIGMEAIYEFSIMDFYQIDTNECQTFDR